MNCNALEMLKKAKSIKRMTRQYRGIIINMAAGQLCPANILLSDGGTILADRRIIMRQTPVPQEIYRHFKGNLYQIITVAEHSETGEELVIYQALYGSFKVYARPLTSFMERTDKEKYPDAGQEYRFELVKGKGTPQEGYAGDGENANRAAKAPDPDRRRMENEEPQRTEGPQRSKELQRGEEQDSGEVNLDPLVIEFLDASSYEQRLNILSALHHKITDDMINIMSIALDIEVKPGDVEERYAEFRSCLALMEKYECNRLR